MVNGYGRRYFCTILQFVRTIDDDLLVGFKAALQNHHRTLGGVDHNRLHDDGAASWLAPCASRGATAVAACSRLVRWSGVRVWLDQPHVVVVRAVLDRRGGNDDGILPLLEDEVHVHELVGEE